MPDRKKAVARALAATVLLMPCQTLAQSSQFLESMQIYGHFSPSGVYFQDGSGSSASLADNSQSGGRVGVWFQAPFLSGQIRFNIESSLGLRTSAALSQDDEPPLIDLNATTIRKFEVIYDTDRLGSIALGQGNMASDSVSESDLSGTQLAAYVGIADTAGGYLFRNNSGIASSVSIRSAFPTYDGGSAPRIRWDSPSLSLDRLGTLGLAVAIGVERSAGRVILNESLADVGLLYNNRLGEIELKASGGASIAEVNGETTRQAAASFSLLHPESGWNATVAAGARKDGGQYAYWKIGLKRRWIEWGDTSVSIDLYNGVDTAAPGSRSKSYGIGVVQTLERRDLQIYLGVRSYDLSSSGGVTYRSSHSMIFGTKWVFKRLSELN